MAALGLFGSQQSQGRDEKRGRASRQIHDSTRAVAGQVVFFEKGGEVDYRLGEGEVEKMDYLELIARVTSHIPDKGQVMVRYYGLYANAHRGKAIKAGGPAQTLGITEYSKRSRRGWASMIRKVYEVDPMVCPVCAVGCALWLRSPTMRWWTGLSNTSV
jgi:putative transposase